ncbi:MAG: DoxX family protein [Steroidobacteraceae bacterium]
MQTQNPRNVALAALLLRLGLGGMFIAHALLKYFVFTLPGTAQFFGALGLPPWLAYPTFAAELIGGALLVAGWQTRVIALALLPVMLGATWAHAGNGWLFSAPQGGWEYPAFLTLGLVVQALLGDGALALRRAALSAAPRAATTAIGR